MWKHWKTDVAMFSLGVAIVASCAYGVFRVNEEKKRQKAAIATGVPAAVALEIETIKRRAENDLIDRMQEARRPPANYLADKRGIYWIGDKARIYQTTGSGSVRYPWAYDYLGRDCLNQGVCATFDEALEAVRPALEKAP